MKSSNNSGVRRFANARVYSYVPQRGEYAVAGGLVLQDDKVVSLDERDALGGRTWIDLDGMVVLPAFADCHVHMADTGLTLGKRNFNAVRSYDQFAESVAALPQEQFVFGGNYDENDWDDGRLADAAPLERFFPDSLTMLTRVDGHSCIVNRRTMEWLALAPQMRGIEKGPAGEPTGKLFLDANWQAQFRFFGAIPEATRRDAEKQAAQLAISRGAVHLHAQLVGFAKDAYAGEIEALRAIAGPK